MRTILSRRPVGRRRRTVPAGFTGRLTETRAVRCAVLRPARRLRHAGFGRPVSFASAGAVHGPLLAGRADRAAGGEAVVLGGGRACAIGTTGPDRRSRRSVVFPHGCGRILFIVSDCGGRTAGAIRCGRAKSDGENGSGGAYGRPARFAAGTCGGCFGGSG